jgi:hypothetical protein
MSQLHSFEEIIATVLEDGNEITVLTKDGDNLSIRKDGEKVYAKNPNGVISNHSLRTISDYISRHEIVSVEKWRKDAITPGGGSFWTEKELRCLTTETLISIAADYGISARELIIRYILNPRLKP